MRSDEVLDIIFASNRVGESEAENSDSDIEDGDLSPDDEEEPSEDSSSDEDSENTDTEDPEQWHKMTPDSALFHGFPFTVSNPGSLTLHESICIRLPTMTTCHVYSAYINVYSAYVYVYLLCIPAYAYSA